MIAYFLVAFFLVNPALADKKSMLEEVNGTANNYQHIAKAVREKEEAKAKKIAEQKELQKKAYEQQRGHSRTYSGQSRSPSTRKTYRVKSAKTTHETMRHGFVEGKWQVILSNTTSQRRKYHVVMEFADKDDIIWHRTGTSAVWVAPNSSRKVSDRFVMSHYNAKKVKRLKAKVREL